MGTRNVRALLLAVMGPLVVATVLFIAGEGSNRAGPVYSSRIGAGEIGDGPAAAKDAGVREIAPEKDLDHASADVRETAREFVLWEKGQRAVHGIVDVPDGWYFGAWQRQVIIRNIPIEEVSYGGGVAEVRIEPPDYPTSGGVELGEMSDAGSIIVGGNAVSRMKWIAPLEGDDSGELTRAVVVDDEGRAVAQVVTYMQAPTSTEKRYDIDVTFREILASLETRPIPDSTGWERRELLSSAWRFRARVPGDWTISAVGEEAFQVSGLDESGNPTRMTVERVDTSGPTAANAIDQAYEIGALLMGRRALRVPGPQRRYLLVRDDGKSLWGLHFEAGSLDDLSVLFSIARATAIDPIDTAPAAYPGP